MTRVELLCVGSELLRGKTNTHVATIGRRLASLSLPLARETTLPDDQDAITREIAAALRRCELLIVCGGLGPTFDDITREAAAAALGRPLRYQPAILARIQRRFGQLRLRMPQENRRQAYALEGALVLVNRVGTAPGQLLTLPPLARAGAARTLVLLPGPWHELEPMLEREVLPRLKRTYASRGASQTAALHLGGISESAADERLQHLTEKPRPGLEFTILSAPGQVDFFITARADDNARARALVRQTRAQALAAVGDHVLWEGPDSIEEAVGRELGRRGLTLGVAESCTGGLIGARLTGVPGSSAYFKGSIAAYSNEVKRRVLGVGPAILARHGAVSAECCRAMALGARRVTRAELGLSVTGIAGPSGGSPEKPVGLVYIGVAGPGGRCTAHTLRLPGDRAAVRARAAMRALQLLLTEIRS